MTSPDPEPEPVTMSVPTWERHPADLARFVIALLITAMLVILARVANKRLALISTDLVHLFANIPAGFTAALVGLAQLVVVAATAGTVFGLLWQRRWRLLGLLVAAAGSAALVMVVLVGLLHNRIPVELAEQRAVSSWVSGAAFPSASLLAAAAAVVTATATFVSRSWHRAAWAVVGSVAFLRLLTATEVPINLLLILSVGAALGSLTLVVFGAPHRRVDPSTIITTLAAVGIPVVSLTPLGTERTAPSFRAQLADANESHVALLGRDQRDYDLLLRIWRALRIKGFNDRRPISSPRRAAEHEQLALALTAAAGVSASRPLALGLTEDGAAVVATTWVDGTPLGRLAPAQITDELLVAVWNEVAALHRRRIAHCWLNLDSIMIDDGHASLVGFRWSANNADDTMLGADVAELLSSLAAHIGVERAVSSARSGLGDAALSAALPLFQPLVLSAATRDQLKAAGITLGELRDKVSGTVGLDEVELAPLRRVSLKGIVSLVGSLVLAFYVLSLASDWRSIADAFGQMNWAVVPLLIAMVLAANIGGALSLMGSVNIELPFLRTNLIQFAQGFLNRFTPANAGGMALRARYLQREGVDLTVGAAAVGLGSAASGMVQIVFMLVFLVWGGAAHELSRFKFPSVTKLLGFMVLGGIVIGAIALSGWGKRVVVPKVRCSLGPALENFRRLAAQPAKLTQLFGGNSLMKLANLVAFAACVSAFGESLGFARIGALYMVANTIGAAVPTPGGVGGLEAALTAALISGGVDAPTAGAIVLVFRLFTFWLPTIPGWACLQQAQRTGIV